jgi:hypothetical protein
MLGVTITTADETLFVEAFTLGNDEPSSTIN